MEIGAQIKLQQTRRTFLGRMGIGLGAMALQTLLQPAQAEVQSSSMKSDRWEGVIKPLPFLPRAKRIIFLCMAGGPSQLETFDYKPKLLEMDGKPMPASYTVGQPIAQLQGSILKCLGPQHAFKKSGQSGQLISTALPNIAKLADDICIVRSMQTEQINHDPAHLFLSTGTAIPGRPSMGSWWLYGLGSEAENLPGFVVLTSSGGGQGQPVSARQWHSGFLPGRFQGVQFQSNGDPVMYAGRPPGVGVESQREVIDAVGAMNRLRNDVVNDPELATRISQYEMAFRMQASVPELVDLKKEPQYILDAYGTTGNDGSFAANCLLARRLVERGVRFVQLYHRGWDHHEDVKSGVLATSALVDKATAALVLDLRRRVLLEDTLIIWGGEFGRTPMAQGNGRDHHIRGYSMWLAGGGIKPGISYGNTDELGYQAVENQVSVHDLHATALRLFGVDHLKLTYRFQGRDFRLTDVSGNVVKEILA